jgi:hypothetical protein
MPNNEGDATSEDLQKQNDEVAEERSQFHEEKIEQEDAEQNAENEEGE